MLQLPPALRENVEQRLQAATKALDTDDFSDKTLKEACQISKKARASSTKTRQAVIGRAPRSLVIHVNRSVFDEMTGDQKKNYAAVRYPQVLDLGKWMLGSRKTASNPDSASAAAQDAIADASQSMLSDQAARDQCLYRLKAVITHYGRHENGHYIAYRQHPPASHAACEESDEPEDLQPFGEDKLPWWRLSDEDVSSVPDEDVLQQGGVFMLFYEREEESPISAPSAFESLVADVAATKDQKSAVESATPVEEVKEKQEEEEEEQSEPPSTSATRRDAPETKSSPNPPEPEINSPPAPAPAPTSEPSTTTTTTSDESESEADTNTDTNIAIENNNNNNPTAETAAKRLLKTPAPTTTQPRMRTARANSAAAQSDAAGFASSASPVPHRVVAAT